LLKEKRKKKKEKRKKKKEKRKNQWWIGNRTKKIVGQWCGIYCNGS
jgi:hypothetical protein